MYSNLYWNLKPFLVLFVDQSKGVDATKHIKMLEDVCTEFKGKIHCAYANGLVTRVKSISLQTLTVTYL